MAATAFMRRADAAGRWSAVALGFTLPISVALDSVLLLAVVLSWLASGAYPEKIARARTDPVAVTALVLLALLGLGTLYGSQAPGDAGFYFKKYSDLLFIPMFAYWFRDATTRRRGLLALAISIALTLAVSLCLKLGVLPPSALTTGDELSPTAFKLKLTHNILMAFGAFLFAWLAISAENRRAKWGWTILAALAAFNVIMMVQGATGYLVLGALALLLAHGIRRWRGVTVAVPGVAIAAILLMYLPGPFSERVNRIGQEYRGWEASQPQDTSIGLRLEFYRNTLEIIREHPWVGVGTGGFPRAYEQKIAGTGMTPARNPHNEFMHIAVQIGPLGLATLLLLFWQQWRLAPRLATRLERELARGLVVLMLVGCLYNSLLLDHTEGLLYAWLTGLLCGGLKSGERGTVTGERETGNRER
jgi:O-antigen ligase